MKTAFARTFGERFHPAMIKVSTAIKNDRSYVCCCCAFSEQFAHCACLIAFIAGIGNGCFLGRSLGDRTSSNIVNTLAIDVPIAAENAEARACCGSSDFLANAIMNAFSAFCLSDTHVVLHFTALV